MSTGEVIVNATILVNGTTFDGGCKTHVSGPGLEYGDGDQTPDDPMFRVENGGALKNVIIRNSAGNGHDGIYVYAGATLENINSPAVLNGKVVTIKSVGTVNATAFTAAGTDVEARYFQVNAASTLNMSNCVFRTGAKVYRQNGGTTFKTIATIDRCDISDMNEAVFRTDSTTSTATLTNSRLHNVRTTCMGYTAANCITSNNTTY